MKNIIKVIAAVIIILIIVDIVNFNAYANDDGGRLQKSISSKIIRFHVLANSDTIEDQQLKIKVKNKIINYLQPRLEHSRSINESRRILMKNDDRVKAIAEKVIRKNGYSYSVRTELAKENFPVKSYGAITLSQGRYEAYRVLIGKASGQNWWCVMFPPLCFVDVTKGEVEEKKSERELGKVLNKKEMEYVEGNDIHLRFKCVEVLKGLIEKLK
ncbi:stage II sporulation protein R [Clostridium oryzae]|uniref:Stage II sporulation protein SpoIIR n=1 Tax=Clostridium oryzae TaxID=1450648 RepID=A0A1V4IU33_9CLOT|nr:stage II sporulation protein R [Clostridium oryzae]OPJ63403.1 stage II sporulation protein SpoIIR [Clostridium oryzae]